MIKIFGTQLEQLILVVAIVLALMLALVTLEPWLARAELASVGLRP